MDILNRHEVFEMEVLEYLKSARFLDPLVFGGGTMLRLCYELNRYSSDLDFWFIKKTAYKSYFEKLRGYLGKRYELTDAQIKFYTLLFEIRSRGYPKRLKIEIRKGVKACDFQERIAFSRDSIKQVILRVQTLNQMMKNKIEAALDRRDVRDFFDIEFLLRKGIPLKASKKDIAALASIISKFKDDDFCSTLGAILDPDTRKYYITNKFSYLIEKIGTVPTNE